MPSTIRTLDDAERLARRRLPDFLFESVVRGSSPELTLRENRRAFDEIDLLPRAAVAVRSPDVSTTVLGHRIELPVMTAPTGNVRVFHRAGEPAVARAAGACGTIAIISCFMGYSIEEIAAQTSGPVFFDLYFAGGRANAESMIDRAQQAGCGALVITVDMAVFHGQERNSPDRLDRAVKLSRRPVGRFAPSMIARPRWALDFLRDGRRVGSPMWMIDGRPASPWEMTRSIVEASPTWEDLDWIREQWRGPIVLKGILAAADAARALDTGVDAIVVSNHGGRNIDGAPATMRALPEIVDAVGDSIEVYLDGGVRRGTDVVRALAFGARACLIGRPYIWGLAAAGEEGVVTVLQLFKGQVARTLSGLGCASLAELGPEHIRLRG